MKTTNACLNLIKIIRHKLMEYEFNNDFVTRTCCAWRTGRGAVWTAWGRGCATPSSGAR